MPHIENHFLLNIIWSIDEKSRLNLVNIRIIVKHRNRSNTYIILNISIYTYKYLLRTLYFVKIWKSNIWNNTIYGTNALWSPFIRVFIESIQEFIQSSKFKQLTCSLKKLRFEKEITQRFRVYISHLYIPHI